MTIDWPAGLEDSDLPERIQARWQSEGGDARPWPRRASDVDPAAAMVDEYLIEGVLRPARLMVIAAAEGLGKSRVRMELAMRLATKHGALFDHYRIPGRCRVLTIDVENGDEEEVRREEETRERLGLERSDLEDYWRVSLDGLSLSDAKDQSYVLAAVGQARPSVVILDTASSMVDGDEWGGPLKQAVRYLRSISREYRCAVIVLVHLTKPSRQPRPGKAPAQHGTQLADVMGQWTRQADSVALMADAGEDRIRWSMRKRVPDSTLILQKDAGAFRVAQLIGGEDLGIGMTRRVLNTIAAGESDPDTIASYLGTSRRTVYRHVKRLRDEGSVSPDAPLRVSQGVTTDDTRPVAA